MCAGAFLLDPLKYPNRATLYLLYASLCTGELNAIPKHKCFPCSPFYVRACRWAMLGELKPNGPQGLALGRPMLGAERTSMTSRASQACPINSNVLCTLNHLCRPGGAIDSFCAKKKTAPPPSGLRRDSQSKSARVSVTLSLGTPQYPHGLPTVGSLVFTLKGHSVIFSKSAVW